MVTAPSAGQTETLNGMRIYFETHGTGEALLLLHGFSGSSQDWLPSAPGWGPDFQIILPDLRGFGASDKPREKAAYEDSAMARDVVALIEHLRVGLEHRRADGAPDEVADLAAEDRGQRDEQQQLPQLEVGLGIDSACRRARGQQARDEQQRVPR